MFGPIGMQELIIIFIIALIVFGPRKLPELGKSLGKSLAEFRRASNDLRATLEEEVRVDENRNKAAEKSTPSTQAPPSGASSADGSPGDVSRPNPPSSDEPAPGDATP